MIGIYLLITILSQLSTQQPWLALETAPTEVSVRFERTAGIAVGAPVVVEGQLVGTVSAVAAAHTEHGSFVTVKMAPRHRSLIRRGTVALIASPLSISRTGSEVVLELLLPSAEAPLLQQGEDLNGFGSYEEFWSSTNARPA